MKASQCGTEDVPGSSVERFFISHWTISAPGIEGRTSVRRGLAMLRKKTRPGAELPSELPSSNSLGRWPADCYKLTLKAFDGYKQLQ